MRLRIGAGPMRLRTRRAAWPCGTKTQSKRKKPSKIARKTQNQYQTAQPETQDHQRQPSFSSWFDWMRTTSAAIRLVRRGAYLRSELPSHRLLPPVRSRTHASFTPAVRSRTRPSSVPCESHKRFQPSPTPSCATHRNHRECATRVPDDHHGAAHGGHRWVVAFQQHTQALGTSRATAGTAIEQTFRKPQANGKGIAGTKRDTSRTTVRGWARMVWNHWVFVGYVV
ncbi:hypothetical protein G1C97_2179 [Bifidobacterium sp. DSM 109959]|uniref:Uncharacterized protein n=1 Tax=Bifidobacterium olomucense TaxID=2675324 RepID=A0A7Y0F1B3_9BIFI|nr:hypothetical protein [Bifidobacterium sp. DSM 109959]